MTAPTVTVTLTDAPAVIHVSVAAQELHLPAADLAQLLEALQGVATELAWREFRAAQRPAAGVEVAP